MEYWDSEILNSNHWTVAGASNDMTTSTDTQVEK